MERSTSTMMTCMTPAGRVDFSLTVPADLKSGLYAARLRSGTEEDYIPFVVKPAKGKEKKAGLSAPHRQLYGLCQRAYGYQRRHDGAAQPVAWLRSIRTACFLNEHREYGGSCYDSHSDGSGVCYSSRLRPILNMRPKHISALGGDGSSLWQFNAGHAYYRLA